jgi:hypothetical protein
LPIATAWGLAGYVVVVMEKQVVFRLSIRAVGGPFRRRAATISVPGILSGLRLLGAAG